MTAMGKKPMSRLKKSAGAAALCVTLVGGFEGLRTTAYPDPATKGPPWTICFGATAGVQRGDTASVEECKSRLIFDLQEYALAVERCVTAPLPDERFVALTSFFYNVGVGAGCKSSVVRLLNTGHTREGCDYLLKFNRAAGVVFPGLTRRRQAERELCLKGVG